MTASEVFAAVEDAWVGRWTGPVVLRLAGGGASIADGATPTIRLDGTVVPGFVDHHVHLGLVDASRLTGSAIVEVHDLGWPLEDALRLPEGAPGVRVRVAGPFLTAPGGYPSRSGWAPRGAALAVRSPTEAREAVTRLVTRGVDHVKIALHGGGPTLDDDTARAVVEAARDAGRLVAAHVEGAGQAARALRAGVDRLAHAPWSEHLDEPLLTAMVGAGMSWISTLDIHGWGDRTGWAARPFRTAQDNIRRFARLGGDVRYGTDLGNGPLPVGVNARELDALAGAGLDASALTRAICRRPVGDAIGGPLFHIPGRRSTDRLGAWFASAQRLRWSAPDEGAR